MKKLYQYMRINILSISLFFFFGMSFAEAHVPNIVTQTSLKDIFIIEDPELSQAFYGQMTGFPHTFEIRSQKPFSLFTQILLPDIESSKNNVSGIIIKEQPNGGRVIEITRIRAKDGSWDTWYEPFGGDRYRRGLSFEKELEAGTYRIEVSTPDDIEKYVLVVGRREDMTLGYFELVGRLIEVKKFFEKSPLRVIESPYVYIPTGIIILGIWYMWLRMKRRRSAIL